MVNLTRIYTRTGDDGTTALGDFSRTGKTDSRLVAYADVDEANSCIGVAVAAGLPAPVATALQRVQHDLFDVGADLCTPIGPDEAAMAGEGDAGPDGAEGPGGSGGGGRGGRIARLRVTADYVDRLERLCDEYNAELENLRSFVLPGGTEAAAHLHVARTVTRRAERSAWAALNEHGDTMNPLTARYLNRLSDLLFILSRVANLPEHGGSGDVLWEPGANR